MKKVVAYLLTLVMILSCTSVAMAAEEQPIPLEGGFVPMSREEFLTRKAAAEGITYEEAAQIVDAEIQAALAALGGTAMPLGWTGDTTIDNGDTTYTIYGTVYDNNYHPSGMQAYFYADAVKLYHHYGSQFISTGQTGAWASGFGQYTLTPGSSVSATIINSNSQIRLALNASYEVAEDYAISLGLDFQFLNASATVGGTLYYRTDPFTDAHIETA